MSSTAIFELRDDSDRYPGFLQVYLTEKELWKETIATRCLELGPMPFGTSYAPVPLEFNNEGRKKNSVGDICLNLAPFIIFSEKAKLALDRFLAPSGEFLEVIAPVPGFFGYRILKYVDDCIDMKLSQYMQYDNGAIDVRKPTMYEARVKELEIFTTPNTLSSIFVSSAFRDAVVKAKLKGFDFSNEITLV